ncbi:hypothetical protein [Rhizobium leguminosarum]|uniref:hypothetical protein n=1 Tax=Rhizobium leguminosarum TaxID=384 RepID=UPI00103A0CAC|nr:hypothetical protein [Rhizobium leguminosarum]TBY79540.1 hypothetical protein E0H32_21890 [Rhizobium leguminosarum bv. viciae]
MLSDAIIAKNVADRISDLRRLVPLTAESHEIRAATVWLRDVYEHLDRMWRAVGLHGSPEVPSMAIEWAEPIFDAEAYIFGRFFERADQPLDPRAPGVEFWYDWFMNCNDPSAPSWLMGGDPFIKRPRPVQEYFESNVAYRRGEMISRLDMLEYGAYRLGFIHAEGDRYLRRNAAKAAAIDQAFDARAVEFQIFAIVQELLAAPSLRAFEKAVRDGVAQKQ